jgi:hypothetical protein
VAPGGRVVVAGRPWRYQDWPMPKGKLVKDEMEMCGWVSYLGGMSYIIYIYYIVMRFSEPQRMCEQLLLFAVFSSFFGVPILHFFRVASDFSLHVFSGKAWQPEENTMQNKKTTSTNREKKEEKQQEKNRKRENGTRKKRGNKHETIKIQNPGLWLVKNIIYMVGRIVWEVCFRLAASNITRPELVFETRSNCRENRVILWSDC